MTVIVLVLPLHTEDPKGVGDKVDIFLFLDLSPSDGSEVDLLVRLWDNILRGCTVWYEATSQL